MVRTLPSIEENNANFMMQNPQYSYTVQPSDFKTDTPVSLQTGEYKGGASLTTEPAVLSSANGEKAITEVTKGVQDRFTEQNDRLFAARNAEKEANAAFDEKFKAAGGVPADLQAEVDALKTPEEKAMEAQRTKIDDMTKTALASFDTLALANTQQNQATLESLKSQYQERASQIGRINQGNTAMVRGVLGQLGSRYTPMSSGNLLTSAELAGVARLKDLDQKYNLSVAEANAALNTKNYALANEKYQMVLGIEKDYLDTLKEQAKVAKETNDKIREQEIQATRDYVVADLMSQGVTDPKSMLSILNESGGDFTAKEIGETMKSLSEGLKTSTDKLSGEAKNYFALKEIGALPASVSSLPEDEQLFAFIKQSGDAARKPEGQAGGITGNVPFEQFTREQIALSVVPVQLRNTEVELNRFITGIRQGLEEGLTPYQVADKLMGYSISNPDEFTEGFRQYMAVANLGGSDISDIARLINGGRYDLAISKIDNKVLDEQKKLNPDGYVAESTTRYYTSKVDEILTQIESNGLLDAIGPIEGSLTSIWSKVPYGQRKEAAKLQAKVTSLVSEMRNHLSGTAVTESEKKFLEPLISKLSDKEGIFVTKLEEIRDNSLSRHNEIRSAGGLPRLNKEQVMNYALRVPLYSLSDATKAVINDPLKVSQPSTQSVNNPLGI